MLYPYFYERRSMMADRAINRDEFNCLKEILLEATTVEDLKEVLHLLVNMLYGI